MKPKRILVIDDEEICRFIVQVTFGIVSPSTQVIEADSGASALRLISQEAPFDLILLDINMPGMNGFDFLDALQHLQEEKSTQIPAIAMLTTSVCSLDRVNAEKYSFIKAYLTKPFTEEAAKLLMNLEAEMTTQVL